jgi:hypothetical protein
VRCKRRYGLCRTDALMEMMMVMMMMIEIMLHRVDAVAASIG